MAKTYCVSTQRPVVLRAFVKGLDENGLPRFIPDVKSTPCHLVVGSNPGIPADLWETWLEQNAASDLVVDGLIVAEEERHGEDEGRREA